MIKRSDFSAVIFDMDGLVLETESTYRAAWKEALGLMGHDLAEPFFNQLSGLSSEEVLRAIKDFCGHGFDLNEFNRLSAQSWRSHVSAHGIEIKKGFKSLRSFLVRENIPYCLATNSAVSNVSECLEIAGLNGVFSILVSRDQVIKGKPEPDLFLTAAERLRVPVQRCLVLEDSMVGIAAAVRAGAIPVLIAEESALASQSVELCDCRMNDLEQLLAAIRQ